jgi:hypothetical protein
MAEVVHPDVWEASSLQGARQGAVDLTRLDWPTAKIGEHQTVRLIDGSMTSAWIGTSGRVCLSCIDCAMLPTLLTQNEWTMPLALPRLHGSSRQPSKRFAPR